MRQRHIARPGLDHTQQGHDHVEPAPGVNTNKISDPHPLFGQMQRQRRRGRIQIAVADHLRPAAQCGGIRIKGYDLGKLPDQAFFARLVVQRSQSATGLALIRQTTCQTAR